MCTDKQQKIKLKEILYVDRFHVESESSHGGGKEKTK